MGPQASAPELWGGVECSVVRVGDAWRDQTRETGHHDREDDLALVADLGIRALRYPVLWERVAPQRPDDRDWRWSDRRMRMLRDLGVRPIVGLLHHGSGPHYTNLLDTAFPHAFAAYAGAVAERYPWVTDWTPVNEPGTTARFSALYGHWYPHLRDTGAFLRALANECHATVLAMRAIRRHVPSARLVQTEDLGRVFSTPRLAYQAAYENERRWLSFDLLCGQVDRQHPWHARLLQAGVPQDALTEMAEGEAAPDIIGINHYLTSDRFLDDDLARYPSGFAGGNGRETYADVEAVRVDLPPESLGPEARLRETWQRYRRPLAVTEAHHGCVDIDECVRWLHEVWEAARALRGEGAEVRAVTVWSLFGAVDWRSLLLQRHGAYEPGPFDVRWHPPRTTALADAVRCIAREGRIGHPAVAGPGWWRRDDRFYPTEFSSPRRAA